MREDAADQSPPAEQGDEPPPQNDSSDDPDGDSKKDKKKKHKKKKHKYHGTVWNDYGPGGPSWWNCWLWKSEFYGPLAYMYPPNCSWYPSWFGASPCWSPSWWCEWWPTYSVYPTWVACVPTYVPVYHDDVVVYYAYDDEFLYEDEEYDAELAEEYAPADGELPAEALDPYLSGELEALAGSEDAVAFIEEGAQLFYEGRYAESVDAFRRAMLAEPGNAIPKFAMAHSLFAVGEYGYAAFLIRRGVDIIPTWPSAGPDLREQYGDPDDLIEQMIALEVTGAATPSDPEIRLLSGYVAFFTGDLDTAESEFDALAELAPGDLVATAFRTRIAEIRVLLAEEGARSATPEDGAAPVEEIPIEGEGG